ncbi:GAF domain-containing protein [Mucilaginibacter sp. PAMB04274]|uniref:GAF domain-containing protein n=1 Tax=Mucilaginibacter sp. PAMB04274 TaxID=3138568 RepID=UPI0031F621AB
MERFLDLNISRENELQNIVTLAAEACQTPAAFLVFLDEGRIKSHFKYGFLADDIAVEDTFWNMPLDLDEVLIIPDASQHTALSEYSIVKGHPHVRFYAGVPLITHDGHVLGSLYVLGQDVKVLSERRKRMLELLSRQAVTMVEFELGISILKEQFVEAKSAENKLRSFFESSKSSHLLINPDMKVITFNKTFRDITYTVFGKEVTTGANATNYIYPTYADDFIRNVEIALTGESLQHERLVELGKIAARWFKISYNPSYDSAGNIIGVSFNATDISERKKNEEKILQQNEALRKIAFMQSHELRKPVASILGLMHLLKLEDPGAHSDIMKMLEATVQELDTTIHRIVQNTETQTDTNALSENYLSQ